MDPTIHAAILAVCKAQREYEIARAELQRADEALRAAERRADEAAYARSAARQHLIDLAEG